MPRTARALPDLAGRQGRDQRRIARRSALTLVRYAPFMADRVLSASDDLGQTGGYTARRYGVDADPGGWPPHEVRARGGG